MSEQDAYDDNLIYGEEAQMMVTKIQCKASVRLSQDDKIKERTTKMLPAVGWLSLSLSKKRRAAGFLSVAVVILALLSCNVSPAFAGGDGGVFLVGHRPIAAPAGFSGLCSKYSWVCAPSGQGTVGQDAVLRLAKTVNNQVNRRTRQIDDKKQYGKEEYWALPTARGGDCEDLVLLKKKTLLESGVSSESLLIATVLDRKLNSHAVLILRTQKGDLVLDNLTNKIVPWKATGYTFLKLQDPQSLSRWQAVLVGGVIKDTPTASK
jgi:predicted transglutaminase-like cysteine proteinase